MSKQAVAQEPMTFSYEFAYSDLMSGPVGAQAVVVAHPIMPPGWEVHEVEVETLTAFNNTTATLSGGLEGAPTNLFTGLNIKALGYQTVTLTKRRATTSVALVLQLTTATDNPTAGAVRVTFELWHVQREN